MEHEHTVSRWLMQTATQVIAGVRFGRSLSLHRSIRYASRSVRDVGKNRLGYRGRRSSECVAARHRPLLDWTRVAKRHLKGRNGTESRSGRVGTRVRELAAIALRLLQRGVRSLARAGRATRHWKSARRPGRHLWGRCEWAPHLSCGATKQRRLGLDLPHASTLGTTRYQLHSSAALLAREKRAFQALCRDQVIGVTGAECGSH